jgi:hypothetical protein
MARHLCLGNPIPFIRWFFFLFLHFYFTHVFPFCCSVFGCCFFSASVLCSLLHVDSHLITVLIDHNITMRVDKEKTALGHELMTCSVQFSDGLCNVTWVASYQSCA